MSERPSTDPYTWPTFYPQNQPKDDVMPDTDTNRELQLRITHTVALVALMLLTIFALGFTIGKAVYEDKSPPTTVEHTTGTQNPTGSQSTTKSERSNSHVEHSEDEDRPFYPECREEDTSPEDRTCYWNAGKHGNGQGKDFIKYSDGTIEYVD